MAGRKKQTKSYRTWAHIKERCENPNCKAFNDYGGRGIKLCDDWHDFENFYKCMGEPPSAKHTIERIDNNGNSEPDNCKWATMKEQHNNTRFNHFLEFNGKRNTVAQWGEITGINASTIHTRIRKGWSVERTLTQKVRRSEKGE